jgi:SPP1 family predicted phage head-tail adaptor
VDPCVIQPGTLKHIVSISAPSTTRDTAGQLNAEWSSLLTTRAAILSTASFSFKFSFAGNALASNATDLIQIRYPAVNVEPGMQVAFGDEQYIVNAVDDVQRRHRVLNMACTGLDISSS